MPEAPRQVFVSYSHADRPFVEVLLNDLKDFGVRVWIDLQLELGDSLIVKVSDAIRASDYVVACLSKASVASNWVRKELAIATTIGINGNLVFVLPLLLSGLEDRDIPVFLLDALYGDFRGPSLYDAAFGQLIRRLRPEGLEQALALPDMWRGRLPLGFTRASRLAAAARDDRMKKWVLDYLDDGLQGSNRRADPTERHFAYLAIGQIGGRRAIEILRGGTRDENEWARTGAEEGLRLVGS